MATSLPVSSDTSIYPFASNLARIRRCWPRPRRGCGLGHFIRSFTRSDVDQRWRRFRIYGLRHLEDAAVPFQGYMSHAFAGRRHSDGDVLKSGSTCQCNP